MTGIIKKSAKILGSAIAVILILMLVLPILFKGKIIKIANEQANANLNAVVKFDDINLSLFRNFPSLGVRVKNISVAGKDIFKGDTLFASQNLDLGINLFGFIADGEVNIKTISLDKPVINIIFLKDGKANYDIALPDSAQPETSASKDEDVLKINLKKVTVKNGNFVYDDKGLDMALIIKNLNMTLKGDMAGDISNFDFISDIEKFSADYEGVRYLSEVNVKYNAKITSDLKNWKFTFNENSMKINELALKFDGFIEMPDTNIYTDIKFSAPDNNFKSALSLIPAIYANDFKDLKTSGDFSLKGYVKGNYNDYSMPAFGIDLLVKNARFQYPDLPKSVENINVNMKIDAEEGSGENMIIDIKNAHFEMASNPVNLYFYAKMTAADIDMKGNIDGKINFATIKDVVPLTDTEITGKAEADIEFKGKMSDIENEKYDKFYAEGIFKLTDFIYKSADMPETKISVAEMFFSPQFVNLKQFKAQTPKSDFSLDGKIYGILAYAFSDKLLKADFNFNSEYIDINEFMSESSSDENTKSAQPEPNSQQNSEPVQIPENIDFTLNSKLKKVKYDNLEISDITGKITAKEGKAKLENIIMKMLGGKTKMNGSYSAVNIKEPKADFTLNFNDFDIPQIYKSFVTIKKLAPITEHCQGKINGNISVQTILDNEMMPVYKTLNGEGNFSSKNIGIKNNKIFNSIAEKTKYKDFADPVLNDLNISFEIENGNISVKPTTFKIAGVKSTFEGNQTIDGTIDYKTKMELPQKLAANVLSLLPETAPKNIDVTVNIGGTIDNPKITGFSSSLTENLKETALEKVSELTGIDKEKADAILKTAREKADLIIETAKKQADNIRTEADKAGKLLISEAKKQGDKLISQATNPVTKKAAQLSADKLVKEAEEKAANLNTEADKKAVTLTDKAKAEADKIMTAANSEAEKLK